MARMISSQGLDNGLHQLRRRIRLHLKCDISEDEGKEDTIFFLIKEM